MEKHAIPQNIMDVEFKLFGSLTVKQFISLATGILIGVSIYFIKLPIIVGWPLIAFSVIIGFSMAFMTINGQPFGRWFTNFMIALVSSQKYVWKKAPKTPKALKTSTPKQFSNTDTLKTVLKKELGHIPIAEVVSMQNDKLDDKEVAELSRLDTYFESEFEKQQVDPSKRVNLNQNSVAGENNPIGRSQRQVKVGDNTKVVYSEFNNQKQRPLSSEDIDKVIDEKIRVILERQKDLNPYIKTEQIEKQEEELKNEMKKLYNEVQSLKKSKNG